MPYKNDLAHEALRMLASESQRILFVMAATGEIQGIVTGGDILRSLQTRGARSNHTAGKMTVAQD